MTQPIGGSGRNPYNMIREDGPAGLNYCRDAHTVVAGALCDEPTVISNACRSQTSDVDRFLCDDKQLASVQHSVWDTTKDVLKMIFTAIIGGRR